MNFDRVLEKIHVADCWHWTAYCDKDGYGRYRGHPAHRLVYENLVGPIPEGLQIDHLCRNRSCVNPDHLEPVTPAENSRRRKVYVVPNQGTHCKHGHEYTEENTYMSRGKRYCRACNRKAQDDYRKRKMQ